MPFDQVYLVYGALFLGVLFFIEGLYYLLVDLRGAHRDPNRRLRLLSAGKSREAVMIRLRRQRRWGGGAHGKDIVAALETLIVQAGVTASLYRVLFVMVAIGGAAFLVVFAVKETVLWAAPAAILLGVVAPVLYLLARRRLRLRRFARQLPDAIDMIVRSLKAGHPVPTAIGMVSREMPDPIGSEFGIAVDEMTYGLDLDQALQNMGERVGVPDLNFLVVAVSIQLRVGGNLAEILSNLSRIIRERFRMRGKIRALSAEGRFSAVVLSVIPFVMMSAITFLRPDYYAGVSGDPLFLPIMATGFTLTVLGILVMYKMVNFRV